MEIKRRKTRNFYLGNIGVGCKYPITIQSMTNTITANIDATVAQILSLEELGCDIIRVAIPNIESAKALEKIKSRISIPIVADIHYDYNLAILSIEHGADGIRINPGNIGSYDKVKKIADAVKMHNIPIRVGSNSGSLSTKYATQFRNKDLPEDLKRKIVVDSLVDSALKQCMILESMGVYNIKVSLKSSGVITTIMAYRKFSSLTDYPLHIGVTEAGTMIRSSVKSSIAMGVLLLEGIGDTIRVSITGDPKEEIKIGKMILESLYYREPDADIISCPTCARTNGDITSLVRIIEDIIDRLKIKGYSFVGKRIAVMGCSVNGPGESKDADLGIAGASNGKFVIFLKGRSIGAYSLKKALEIFEHKLEDIADRRESKKPINRG